MSGEIDKLTEAAKSAAAGLLKVADGSATLNDVFGVFQKTISATPVLGDALGKVAGVAGDATLKLNGAMNATANYGTSFTNNIGQFRESIGNARMTTDDWNKVVSQNSIGMSGYGKNMDQSSKRFLEFGAILQESNVAQRMKDAGVSNKEFTDLMAITMTNRRTLDMKDADAKRSAIEGTMELAIQMDDIARITGKSKEAQQKELAASLGRADVQAELLQMTDQQRTGYMKMQTAVGPLGDSVKGLADEIATGGVRTKEGAAKMAALGPAGADFEKAILAMKNAKTKEEQDIAAAQLERAKVRVTEYQTSKEYLDQVKYDRTATGDAARKQFQENATINSQLSAIKNQGVKTEEELIAEKKKAAAESRKGVDQDTGKKEAGSETGRVVNRAQQTLDASMAAAGTGIKKLGDEAGAAAVKINAINSMPTTAAGATKMGEDMLNKVVGGAGAKKPENLQGYTPGKQPVKYFDGTMGPNMDFGNLIKDFGKGTLAELHGKEGVINERQLGALVDKIKSSAKSSADALPMPATPAPAPVPAPAPSTGGDTNTEMLSQMNMLNKMMGQLVSYSEQMANGVGAQLKATKSLSGNRLAV